jgi:hypothetical protein
VDPFEWFKERIGKRVVVDIDGVRIQSWRVHMAGAEMVTLVEPSRSTHLGELVAFYRGIRRFVDRASPGAIVGGRWDERSGRFRPVTREELEGKGKGAKPVVPDHLPDDIG